MAVTEAVLMEQVAMYMAALPCPPLPLIVHQEMEDDLPKECYKNSHDLIASLLILAMQCGDAKLNEKRREKQTELTNKLLQKLKNCNNNTNLAYEACSEFTAGYICAFANINVSVNFMPLHYVNQNDFVHKACCSWHKAQEVILYRSLHQHNDEDKKEEVQKCINKILGTDFSGLSYTQLIERHYLRFSEECQQL